MSLIVQKYGGSSLASANNLKRVAERVSCAYYGNNRLVVVVSAMGSTTDRLLTLAHEVSVEPERRELDVLLSTGECVTASLLAMAINSIGLPARSFTAAQAGIVTDEHHCNARIITITPTLIEDALNAGEIAVVAGFQGVNRKGQVTTLGRGGSDTTAVALAAALKADRCEIYSDVEGVFTVDPRIVPKARLLESIPIDHMLELSTAGARILSLRSVVFAKRHNVSVKVGSTFSDTSGTILCNEGEAMEEPVITGIATDTSQARITIVGLPDIPGSAAEVFSALSVAEVAVDNIVQNFSSSNTGFIDLSFTSPKAQGPAVTSALRENQTRIGYKDLQYDDEVGKITVVGSGIQHSADISAQLFRLLSDAKVNVEMISTSEMRISFVVRANVVAEVARLIHTSFGLDADLRAVVHSEGRV